ncbi:hypothetical protein [Streptomyces tendae]|uniref:Uncharacterized protein n=1 Tax=Streptomyces tendae TaxID=1932 RepID=A0ABX5ZVA6_STRTE|nr:hypothetical protein [Streptomyces tendae]QER88612.1 hypothetical protein F3L20_24615 [Streptomyces tendae]
MSRALFLALVVPLLVAECVAQFVLDDQAWTTVFALLAFAVIAVRWAVGPRAGEAEECPPDCPKCAESLSEGDL